MILFFIFSIYTNAQCAMCRAALESEEGGAQAEGINNGIIFLMAMPYILVAIAFYAVYRLKFKNKKS